MKVTILLGLLTAVFPFSNAIGINLGASLGGLGAGLNIGSSHGGRKHGGVAAGLGGGIGIGTSVIAAGSSYTSSGGYDDDVHVIAGGPKDAGNSATDIKVGSASAGLDVGIGLGLSGVIINHKKERFDAAGVDINAGNESGYRKEVDSSAEGYAGMSSSSPHIRGSLSSGFSPLSVEQVVGVGGSQISEKSSSPIAAEGLNKEIAGFSGSSENGSFDFGHSASHSSRQKTSSEGGKQGSIHSGSYLSGATSFSTGTDMNSHASSYQGGSSWASQSSYSKSYKTGESGFSSLTLSTLNKKNERGQLVGGGGGDLSSNKYLATSASKNSKHENEYSITGGKETSGDASLSSVAKGHAIISAAISGSASAETYNSLISAETGVGLGISAGQSSNSKASSGTGVVGATSGASSIGAKGGMGIRSGVPGLSSVEALYPSNSASKENSGSSSFGTSVYSISSGSLGEIAVSASGSSRLLSHAGGGLHSIATDSENSNGGFLSVKASADGYKNSASSLAADYSSDHRPNNAGASASSSGSSRRSSLGIGLGR